MHILSREMINIAMQMRQRMRNEQGDAPKLNEPDLVEQLLAYADGSSDDHVQRLAARLRELLPDPEEAADPAVNGRVYRGQPVDDEDAQVPTAPAGGARKMYRGQPVD